MESRRWLVARGLWRRHPFYGSGRAGARRCFDVGNRNVAHEVRPTSGTSSDATDEVEEALASQLAWDVEAQLACADFVRCSNMRVRGRAGALDIYTQGEDQDEALANLREAAQLHIEELGVENCVGLRCVIAKLGGKRHGR